MVFLIYNLIYLELTTITLFGHQMLSIDMFLLILLIILNAIRIPNQFHKNKDDLIILFYYKNLEIQSKIKVKIDILKRNLKLFIHLVEACIQVPDRRLDNPA